MMRAIGGLTLAMALVAAVSGGGCFSRSGVCTTVGCADQVSLSLRLENGGRPDMAVSLDIDGRTVECPAPSGTVGTLCATGVTVELRALQTCLEQVTASGARGITCSPNGKFEQAISISGTPTTIRATARNADAAVVAEQTFQPRYMDVQPNGPDCEPTCRQWGDVWMLP